MQLTSNQRLKILRETHGLSQKDLAKALDITPSGYSLIETGKTKINQAHLFILKDKFGFDPDFIIQGDIEKNKPKASSDFDMLRQENLTLREQVRQLMEMVNNLTNSINSLSSKLGKLEGNHLTYAENEGKIIPLSTVSVTQVAKRAA